MKLRSLLVAAALVLGLGSNAHAQSYVRTVDSFDFLVDYSGSMMMTEKSTKLPKMELAKSVLTRLNTAIPDLGYKASMHTAAPTANMVSYGNWSPAQMEEAILSLRSDLKIFGRQTPLGDGMAALASDYSGMARPTAIVLVSDGLNNLGYNPVREAELIMETQPGTCFHVISFADTPEGLATLEAITALSNCSVFADGLGLYNSDAAIAEFAEAVFYDDIVGDALVLRGINFAFDSAELSSQAQGILNEVSALVEADPTTLLLQGWTDSTGPEAYNQVLSERRANSVKAYLVKQGIPANTITTEGMGESFKYDNNTADGRFLNRRVEVLLGQ